MHVQVNWIHKFVMQIRNGVSSCVCACVLVREIVFVSVCVLYFDQLSRMTVAIATVMAKKAHSNLINFNFLRI